MRVTRNVLYAGVALAAVALLSGCYETDIAAMAKHRADCEAADGLFVYWQAEFGGDQWTCDLSTVRPKEK